MSANMNLFQLYQQLRSNPMQVISSRFNIPQGVNMSDPNSIIQHLLNTGQVSQEQVNRAMSMRNNPVLQQLMQGTQNSQTRN